MSDEPNKFANLPEPVNLEDTIAEHDTRTVPDPEGGRNSDQDNALHAGG